MQAEVDSVECLESYRGKCEPLFLFFAVSFWVYSNNFHRLSTSLVYTWFLYFSGVSRVVCGAHLHLLAPWATRLLSECMLHWWRVNGSIAREPFSAFLAPAQ